MVDLIILGRGPSAIDFFFPDDVPIMAVSSGVFMCPEGRLPEHFVTLDPPKWYLGPLTGGGISWGSDDNCRHWAFWREPDITKHVASVRDKPGHYVYVPMDDVIAAVPLKWRDEVKDAFLKNAHAIGFQPGWGDYPSVRPWRVMNIADGGDLREPVPPNFTDPDKPLGLDGMRNSAFMAVQVAHHLGYRRLGFVGVDFLHVGTDANGDDVEIYNEHRVVMEKWYDIAREHGAEWFNLVGDRSALSAFLPSLELANV